MKKLSNHLAPLLKNVQLVWVASILSVSFTSSLWHKYQGVFSTSCTLGHARRVGRFDCLVSSLILMTMDNGRGHCGGNVSNPSHRGFENWKMHAIKQITICFTNDHWCRNVMFYLLLCWTSCGTNSQSKNVLIFNTLRFSRRHFQMHFSRMKMNDVRLKFHWSLFLRFQLTIFQHWFR